MEPSIEKAIQLSPDGYGVIEKQGKRYKIQNLLPGEEAKIQVFRNGYGKVIEFIKLSPDRKKAECPWYNDCGGCKLQHLSYPNQLELKTAMVRELMAADGIDPTVCLNIIGMKDPTHYRNKSQMVISEKNRKVMGGFYEEFTHHLVNVDQCLIQDDRANQIIKTCRTIFQEQKIPPYDENNKTGLIRHILVRIGDATGQILVVIVTTSEVFPGRNNFLRALRKAHPDITSVVQNVNSRSTSMVLGDFERVLFGKGMIEDVLLEKRFLIGARTFFQVNHRQAEILYTKALEFAKPKKDDLVLDLYSGIGAIGIVFCDHVRKVICVEENPQSVKNAILNAKLNSRRNLLFIKSKVSDYLLSMTEEDETPNIIIVDPPRTGLDKSVIQRIIALSPDKIIYISCDPDTLSRDIKDFMVGTYQVKKGQPVDMFPQTNHVETVVLMSRAKG
jgi:23S rRNA (uracil1939-C5)-methyltransferase